MVQPQLYLLSILCIGLGGYILFTGSAGKSSDTILGSHTFHLILGILSAFTGVLKLLSPYDSRVYILGDLIPAVGCITSGFLLFFSIYRKERNPNDTEQAGTVDKLGDNLLNYKKSIGLILIIIAILHFLFPQALFL
jgi:hypothetical protein